MGFVPRHPEALASSPPRPWHAKVILTVGPEGGWMFHRLAASIV